MAVQVGPDNPDNTGQVSDKTRTDKDTHLRVCPLSGIVRFLLLRRAKRLGSGGRRKKDLKPVALAHRRVGCFLKAVKAAKISHPFGLSAAFFGLFNLRLGSVWEARRCFRAVSAFPFPLESRRDLSVLLTGRKRFGRNLAASRWFVYI
jgi:hypothetical protein